MSKNAPLLLSASIVASAAFFAMAGSAQSVPFSGSGDLLPGGDPIGIYLNHFPSGLSEDKIYLDKGHGDTVFGNVGSQHGLPIVDFSSHRSLDATRGYKDGEIEGKSGVFHNLTITVPGFTFGDLLFNVDLRERHDRSDLTIFVYGANGLLDKLKLKGDPDDDDLRFLILANSGYAITKIVLHSWSGFEEFSHFKISELVDPPASTPIPGALLLLGTVLAGATGVGGWRKHRAASRAAA